MPTYQPGGVIINQVVTQTPITWQQWTLNQAVSGSATSISYTTTTTPILRTWDDPIQSQTWVQWVRNGTTSTYSITHEQLWAAWMRDGGQEWHRPPQLDQAELDRRQAAREAESRRVLAERQQRQRLAEMARERSLELFETLLDDQQRVTWQIDRQVVVQGSSGGLYRLEGHGHSVHGNLVQLDEHGCPIARLCVAPEMYDGVRTLPLGDGWVGQLLAIRHDEEALKAKANYSQRRPCQQPGARILRAA